MLSIVLIKKKINPWELKAPKANQHKPAWKFMLIAGLSSGDDNKSEPLSAIMCPIEPHSERCHVNYWLTSLFMRKTDRLSRWCIR